MAPQLVIEVLGDTSNLERSFKRANRASQGFGRSMGQASRGAIAASLSFRGLGRSIGLVSAGFLTGAGLVTGLKSAVSAASNLAEQTSKTNVVFGEASKSVRAWSTTTTQAMGLAQDQALETASSFGALLRPLGLTGAAAAQQSTKLTKLGADLASFYNTSVKDALDAIKSGLVGEVEPLRRYGVLLSETRVQQEGLRQTGKKHAADLTAQEKVLARQALVYRDSAQAQGDFARTSGGLANQQRILTANVRQLQIGIGRELIPEVLKIVREMNTWLAKSENQKRVTDAVKSAVSGLRGVVEGLTPIVGAAATVTQKFSNAVGGAKNAVELLAAAVAGVKLGGLIAGLTATGTAASGAAASTGLLRTRLLGLRTIGPIAVVIGIDLLMNAHTTKSGLHRFSGKGGWANLAEDIKNNIGDIAMEAVAPGSSFAKNLLFGHGDPKTTQVSKAISDASDRSSKSLLLALSGGTAGGGAAGELAKGISALSAKQRNALQLAQAELTKSTSDDMAALLAQRGLLGREIEATRAKLSRATGDEAKKLADTLEGLIGDDAQAFGRITSIQDQAAGEAKTAADRSKAAQKKILDARAETLKGFREFILTQRAGQKARDQAVLDRVAKAKDALQFRSLGLTAEGGERAPGAKALQRSLGSIGEAVKGTFLDTGKNRSLMQTIRKLLSGQLGALSGDVRRTIGQMLDDIDKQLGERGPLTKARAVSTRALTEGLGLTGPQRALFRGRLAGAHLTTMPTSGGPRAGGRARTDLHVHVMLDGREVGRVMVPEIQKRERRAGRQTSGRIGP